MQTALSDSQIVNNHGHAATIPAAEPRGQCRQDVQHSRCPWTQPLHHHYGRQLCDAPWRRRSRRRIDLGGPHAQLHRQVRL